MIVISLSFMEYMQKGTISTQENTQQYSILTKNISIYLHKVICYPNIIFIHFIVDNWNFGISLAEMCQYLVLSIHFLSYLNSLRYSAESVKQNMFNPNTYFMCLSQASNLQFNLCFTITCFTLYTLFLLLKALSKMLVIYTIFFYFFSHRQSYRISSFFLFKKKSPKTIQRMAVKYVSGMSLPSKTNSRNWNQKNLKTIYVIRKSDQSGHLKLQIKITSQFLILTPLNQKFLKLFTNAFQTLHLNMFQAYQTKIPS